MFGRGAMKLTGNNHPPLRREKCQSEVNKASHCQNYRQTTSLNQKIDAIVHNFHFCLLFGEFIFIIPVCSTLRPMKMQLLICSFHLWPLSPWDGMWWSRENRTGGTAGPSHWTPQRDPQGAGQLKRRATTSKRSGPWRKSAFDVSMKSLPQHLQVEPFHFVWLPVWAGHDEEGPGSMEAQQPFVVSVVGPNV